MARDLLLSYLDFTSILALAGTCKTIRSIIDSNHEEMKRASAKALNIRKGMETHLDIENESDPLIQRNYRRLTLLRQQKCFDPDSFKKHDELEYLED